MMHHPIVAQTADKLNNLPPLQQQQVADFVDFLFAKLDDHILQDGIHKLADKGKAFAFLHDEPELYSDKDTIALYHYEG